MNQTEARRLRLETIWAFVRGDMEPSGFAQWAYSQPTLEDELGESLYLETISADYSSKLVAWNIGKSLEAYVRKTSSLRCECITLRDLADVGMGEEDENIFRTLEERAKRGPPLWWLSADQCTACGQWWLVAQEGRINDVFFLKRLSSEDGDRILKTNQWPDDFDKFETLLRLGRERGHSVRFPCLLDSSLLWTAADLARERPGIRISALSYLLNVDIRRAELIARIARREEKVVIDFEQTDTLFKGLRFSILYLLKLKYRKTYGR